MEKSKNGKEIQIKIDFDTIQFDKKTTQKILHELAKTRKKADFFGNTIKVISYHEMPEDLHTVHDPYVYDIRVAIRAVQIENKHERIDYLYDEICFYLDHVCHPENLCEFKNDICFAKQGTDVTMGCCHHYPNKKFGIFYQKKMMPCEYLGEKGCTTKAIGCKLFMCDEINQKGYKFTVFNVLLIRYFFNAFQKIIIKTGIFDTKENIMKRLIKANF